MRPGLHGMQSLLVLPKTLRQGQITLRTGLLILAASCLVLLLLCAQHPSTKQVGKTRSGTRIGSRHSTWDRMRRLRLTTTFHDIPGSKWSCPLRTVYKDVKERYYRPYILGGRQRPVCKNCHRDHLWSHFCHYKSDGPVCTPWDQWRFLDNLLSRAEAGAPGAVEMLTMTPCDLFRILEGRTLWLVGDSQTQEMMKAMQCFFSEFWDLDEEQKPAALASSLEAQMAFQKQPTGWCVTMLRSTRICHLRGNYGSELAQDIFPHLSDIRARASDILVFNFGLWHNQVATFSTNATVLAEYIKLHQTELPFLIWRELSPQHFDTQHGEFGCEGCIEPQFPYKCKAIEHVFLDERNWLHTRDEGQRTAVEGGWRNKRLRPIMDSLGIPVLEVWNQSLPLWDYHHNYQDKQDCTHMCHPSAYQLWVSELYLLLRRIEKQLPVAQR